MPNRKELSYFGSSTETARINRGLFCEESISGLISQLLSETIILK